MNKQLRQYIALACAAAAYYIIHEGAHLLYALACGTFRQINFMGLGIQIDVFADQMTAGQMGVFCLAGPAATLVAAYALTAAADTICRHPSAVFKACMYYVTLALLFLDPLYLSLLCGFVGGGDMNGISLLFPEAIARILFGGVAFLNALLFFRRTLPKYKTAFLR